MPFNLKNFFVVGLGVGVVAAYCMHKPAEKPTAFKAPSGEFKPLSSFGELSAAPAEVANETEYQAEIPFSEMANVSSSDAPDATSQVGFDEEEAAETSNDFIATETDSSMDPMPIMADEFSFEMEDGTPNSEFVAEDVAPETLLSMESAPSVAAAEPVQELRAAVDARWKANPFIGKGSAEGNSTVDVAEKMPAQLSPWPDTSANDADNQFAPIQIEQTKPSVDPLSDAVNHTSDSDNQFSQFPVEQTKPLITNSGTVPSESPQFDMSGVAPLQMQVSEAAAQQAAHHIEYGKSLARRGATHGARQEFYAALRVIAQEYDGTTGSNDFSRSLSQAILAMNEAKDFVNENAEADSILDVASITETHRSNILNQVQAEAMTPPQAMQRYFAFAEHKLDEAGGRTTVAAEAFYCLGKLHTVTPDQSIAPFRVQTAKAIAFHKAALLSNRKNARSANELGVLMARLGELDKAVDLFKQSLLVQQSSNTWRNLAKTHARQGQHELARLAEQEFALAARSQANSAVTGIRWLPSNEFNATGAVEFESRVASRPSEPKTAQPIPAIPEKSKNKSFGERLKSLF